MRCCEISSIFLCLLGCVSVCGFFLSYPHIPNRNVTTTSSSKDRKKRELTRLRYRDCGKPNRSLKIDKFIADPMPIVIPGSFDLKIKANVTRDLPRRMDVRLKLKRKYGPKNWVKLPCIHRVYGSCRYKNLETCVLTQDVFGCPVRKGYQRVEQKFYIPYQEDDFISLLTGEYKAVVRARHLQTKEELICLIVHFSLTS